MRKSLALVLMCAVSLSACKKADQQEGLTNWKNAPPLVAGEDTGPAQDAAAQAEAQASAAQNGAVTAGIDLPPGASPAASTAAGPKLAGTPVTADQVARKPGLWQITTTITRSGGGAGGPGGGGANGAARAGGGANGGQRGPNAGGAPRGPAVAGAAGGGQRGPGGPGGANGGRGGPPPGPAKLCVTADSERQVGVFAITGRPMPGCEPHIAKSGSGFNAASTCTVTRQTSVINQTAHMNLSGDLTKKYTISGSQVSKGGQNGDTTTTFHVTGSYLGACAAGQKGGDETMSDGSTRNILQQGGGGGGGGRRGGGQ